MFRESSNSYIGMGALDIDQLKIMVVSTPKTGNTWIKFLLSAVYDLPLVDLDDDFHPDQLDRLGPRWIGQQHYYPSGPLLDWAQERQVVLVTTVRHPCDVLISLYHYTINYSEDPRADQKLLTIARENDGQLSASLIDHIRARFFLYLNNSISWACTGRSHIVRYEDLWRDPVATLVRLTSQIHPADLDRIERAIERCDIDMLRKRLKGNAKFFRQGQIGNWRNILPPQIVDRFRTEAPYSEQFAALGYTLDPADPLMDAPARPRMFDNPFHRVTHFDNGIEIAPVLMDAYFSLPGHMTRSWEPVESPNVVNTFFGWLLGPAAMDPQPPAAAPLITNLMAHVYRVRPDLHTLFTDPFVRDRIDYIRWFIQNADSEFGIDHTFVDPVEASFVAWAKRPASDDPYGAEPLPLITNLVSYIYNSREDLRSLHPELFGSSRIAFLLWFLKNALREYDLSAPAIEPVSTSFLAWATLPSLQDPHIETEVPIITNLGAALYGLRPDLQASFPDLYGRNRVDFSTWFTENAPIELGLEPSYILPVLTSWAAGAYIGEPLTAAASLV